MVEVKGMDILSTFLFVICSGASAIMLTPMPEFLN
jgi:hypothetical protein